MISPLRGPLAPLARSHRHGGGWAPTTPSGLLTWLDGADGATVTQSSGLASRWADKSGLGNHATQVNASFLPTYELSAINGLGAMRSGGSVSTPLGFASNPILGATAATLLFVAKCDTADTGAIYGSPVEAFGTFDTGDNFPFDGACYFGFGSSGRPAEGVTGYATIDAPHVYTCQSADGLWNLFQDATQLLATTSNTFAANPGSAFGPAICGSLFAGSGGAHQWGGWLAELLIYGRILSGGEMTQARSYLKSKWGTP